MKTKKEANRDSQRASRARRREAAAMQASIDTTTNFLDMAESYDYADPKKSPFFGPLISSPSMLPEIRHYSPEPPLPSLTRSFTIFAAMESVSTERKAVITKRSVSNAPVDVVSTKRVRPSEPEKIPVDPRKVELKTKDIKALAEEGQLTMADFVRLQKRLEEYEKFRAERKKTTLKFKEEIEILEQKLQELKAEIENRSVPVLSRFNDHEQLSKGWEDLEKQKRSLMAERKEMQARHVENISKTERIIAAEGKKVADLYTNSLEVGPKEFANKVAEFTANNQLSQRVLWLTHQLYEKNEQLRQIAQTTTTTTETKTSHVRTQVVMPKLTL